ncbi:hypothetical protein SAMN04487857_107205 [Pseudomonas sp. ok272]|uniref:hypothetical protein n=1 Tax=unclassified Pseudomonas TaxID=196821 RepID=UPI0008B92762|nr:MULTISPECIES: hypothetical protein [unclassified Pseudomonas]SEM95634.1 hypothetical protein SAMN04487857_107205 [Pseudomonas sp. ok272]SFM92752.1 hypothetical protein SAMN04487858_10912 [Pseudomonas sp. ok602]
MVLPFIGVAISAIASAVAAITPVIASIAPAVATFCTTVLPKIMPALIGGLEKLNTFVTVVQAVLQVVQVFRPGEQLKDIGDRAIQAARQDIKPEYYDSFDAYMDEIRAFELDPAASESLSDTEKYAAGLAVGAQGMDHKFEVREGTMANLWPLVANNPEYFNSTRLTALLSTTTDVISLLKYFEGKLGPAAAAETEGKIVAAEKAIAPQLSEEAIYAQLDAAVEQFKQPQPA